MATAQGVPILERYSTSIFGEAQLFASGLHDPFPLDTAIDGFIAFDPFVADVQALKDTSYSCPQGDRV